MLIEHYEAVDHIDEILSVPGVDIVFADQALKA
jgi:2-keto-3-deoxy-L-rhamnonate aldolase RhmA